MSDYRPEKKSVAGVPHGTVMPCPNCGTEGAVDMTKNEVSEFRNPIWDRYGVAVCLVCWDN